MGGLGLMAARAVAAPLIDAGFPQLKSRIIERTGHFYYQDKDDLLWERVRKRLRATGLPDSTRYLTLLDDAISGPAEWGRLEAEITIGETFFFRYAEQFTALRDTILPEIIARKSATRRLRIWSAGCSTGAEAFSLSILVNEILGKSLEDWRIVILGTDINDSFLKAARQAQFGKWALRSMPPQERERYFIGIDKDRWQVRPEFRSIVRFERHNLLSLLDGTSPLELTEFDLILCRNVLIYFHPDTVVELVGALRDRLTEDGWMLLGHAEPNPTFSTMMQVVNLPGTVAYRHGSGAATTPAPPVSQLPALPPPEWKPFLPPPKPAEPVKAKRQAPPSAPTLPKAPSASDEPDALLEEIRARADAGDFAAADGLCRKALAEQPLDARLHFYRGLVLRELRRPGESEKSFLNSLYLDKSFAMAHYHLGLLLLADGRSGSGRRSLTNAARIAATMPGDRQLDEADGLTAKDLRDLVRAHLAADTPARRGG
ncbi:CheR family methyltransferase [Microvirga zambiensis]|uniref:CheR family methyltransferase n=1 Tax=Microvirga zambiensis TaxID=1402137 RepID=UPI001FE5F34B|nr:protein-glutamate O-methyltransferase CheR [Microvirga zambiensis]